jgi:hypothetical protein
MFLLCGVKAARADDHAPKITTTLRSQAVWDSNSDLGSRDRGTRSGQFLEAKVRATGFLGEKIKFLWEGRGVKNFGEAAAEDPVTGDPLGNEDFLEWRQSWVEFTSASPLSLRFGRQRFAEPYSIWWNRDSDAGRLIYTSPKFNAFLAGGQNLTAYRTSGDDFNADDEDIARILGETSWQWRDNQFAEARFAFENDYSGTKSIGSLEPRDDRDDSDAKLYWAGFRLSGHLPSSQDKENSYRVDVMGVNGKDKQTSTTSGPGNYRTITGTRERDVMGWAVDAGANIHIPFVPKAALILGYAYGSGDDDPADGTDNGFRQTGLHSNYSRPGQSLNTLHNYGSAFRPELTNLSIASLGFNLPFLKASDFSIIYRYYRLNDKHGELGDTAIDAPLTGNSNDIGNGLDIMADMNISKELGWKDPALSNLVLKTTFGVFRAGNAYGTREGETALRGIVELTKRF